MKAYVGIDVSKDTLEIKFSDQDSSFERRNTASGVKRLAAKLSKSDLNLSVLEATGGYERLLVKALLEHGVPVSVINPHKARSFAKSLGIKAKTDPIDAALLCRYAESVQPEPGKPISPEVESLQSLVIRRNQLVEMLTAEKNRLKAPTTSSRTRKSIQSILDSLN